MAKGGGSANKSFLFQETKAVLNPTRMLEFLDEKIRSLGTAACPPYHLAVVIGGTSAEFALKTAKYASAHYLDNLPTSGSMSAHGFRDLELEEEVWKLTQSFGIGAQFGGKYFCHDVRVVRLPRHGASCPVAIAVSCSADRQALGKITAEGVFLEQLETDPAHYMPDAGIADDIAAGEVVSIDLNRPMDEIRAELSKHPVKTRLSLTGPLVVARDIAHAKIKERLDAGEEMPQYLRDHPVYYAGPAKTPEGHGVRLVRSDDGRPHGLVRRAVPGRGRLAGDARQGQPLQGRHRGLPQPRRLLPRLDRRPRRPAGPGLHQVRVGAGVRGARHGGGLEDRGRGLPRVHRRRRQGQRLLHRPVRRGDRADLRRSGCARHDVTDPVEYVELARAESERGELVLRERRPEDGPVSLELRANGVFVMDNVEVSTERALAREALALVDDPRAVVVGGLGLGFTMHEVLADSRVELCSVVEIEQSLVDWMRDGTIPHGPALLADGRVNVVVADVAVALAEARPASYDLVLLDVDNGPGYLVHAGNAALYEPPALAAAKAVLRPGGALVIWSMAESPDLEAAMGLVFGDVEARAHEVRLQERDEQYWLYVARVTVAT